MLPYRVGRGAAAGPGAVLRPWHDVMVARSRPVSCHSLRLVAGVLAGHRIRPAARAVDGCHDTGTSRGDPSQVPGGPTPWPLGLRTRWCWLRRCRSGWSARQPRSTAARGAEPGPIWPSGLTSGLPAVACRAVTVHDPIKSVVVLDGWARVRASSVNAREDMINFLEHCILVASGSPQTSDGEAIQGALRLVAEAFCPDLLSGAITPHNMATDEITVERAFGGAASHASARRPGRPLDAHPGSAAVRCPDGADGRAGHLRVAYLRRSRTTSKGAALDGRHPSRRGSQGMWGAGVGVVGPTLWTGTAVNCGPTPAGPCPSR